MAVPEQKFKYLRTAKMVTLFAVIYFFVLPLVPGFRQAINQISEVDPGMLFVGVGLQAFSLLAYTLLTRAALGQEASKISTTRLFRIQLSTKALGNIMPGGSAASSALGYRLLTTCGISGPDAGFALATAGIGSAMVLNVILWLGLIISIPGRGVNPIYGTAAVVGIILMAFAAFLIFGLVEGQGRSERMVRRIARRVRYDEERAADVLQHLGLRVELLAADHKLLIRVVGWATVNWILDGASLWVMVNAFGGSLHFDGLVVAFGLANVMAVIPITPGGLGIVEGIYIPTLVGFGLTRTVATVSVLTYRVAQFWLPILVGWLCYLSLRVGPFSIERMKRLGPMPALLKREVARGVNNVDWVERFAPKDRTGQFVRPTVDKDELEYSDDDSGSVAQPELSSE